ncbi:MAG: tripartite tricarboxylate transporter substrate binding protein [Betaproteobacteria bacterium]|jgi:tripartite-type tricarboxylate transporter receptor subunit TctC|nr:tripartite tricarboxylate transporter substrate binding protein [Betaproteobacteria bacterium]
MASGFGLNLRLALIAMSALHAGVAIAQAFPVKPLRFIVSTSAGSGADVIGRLVGGGMTAVLGQQVVVENRTGASGAIGSEFVAKAVPDGYTMLQVSATHTVAAALSSKLPYDLLRDFTPVTQVANAPNAVVAHPSLPAKSIPELVKLAKSRPGAVSFGSAGTGAPSYSAGALFAAMAGVELLHVPYRGGGEALTAVLTGETQLMFGPIASTLPHIQRGGLRLLALTSAKRSPLLPNVPTIAEAGYPNYAAGNWYGIVLPLKTPKVVVTTLRNAVLTAIGNAEISRRLTDLGYVVVGDQPEEFAAFMKNDFESLRKSFRAIGVSID